MFVSAILLGLYSQTKGHHYSEHGIFFKEALDDRQVVGVAFVEYDGPRLMELIQWKVELVRRYGQRITLYRKSSVFQEKVPHQPTVKISGHEIHIDDGEDKIAITVQASPEDEP